MMTPRCRCGEPARWTLVYVWNDVEERREARCDKHFHETMDWWEVTRRKSPSAVDGLRILVSA